MFWSAKAIGTTPCEENDAFLEVASGKGVSPCVVKDSTYISRVTEALSRYPNTFLIVPSPDPQEAADLLYGNIMSHPLKRYVATRETIYEINEHAVRLYSRYPLAKHVVYT